MNHRSFKTASLEAYQALRDDILDGRRRPGDRLVRRTIASELGMSPIPVMEALLRLEQDGLVQSAPMFGSRVKELTIDGLINEQVFREAIECQASRSCAEKASDSQLSELQERAELVDQLMSSGDNHSREGRISHMNFHLLIARYSGFPILESKLKTAGFMEVMHINWISATKFSVPAGWHRQLIETISTRDPALAEAKMRQHVRYNLERQIDALKTMLDDWKSSDGGKAGISTQN